MDEPIKSVAEPIKVIKDPVSGTHVGVVENPPAGPALSLPPTTTHQEDIVVASQRRVNLIWEVTQAFIAVVVVTSNMLVSAYRAFAYEGSIEVPIVMSSTLFLVVGFYFSRTNHAAIGGVGAKPMQEYIGR